jgi:ABC-type antimicrobial peptide transport system permease subunit
MLMGSPYDPVRPTIYYLGQESEANFIFIRLVQGQSVRGSLDKIRTVFQQYVPSAPFDYKFTDEDYADKFRDEERIGRLSLAFTLLAIFISCMGLFGMASFMTEQRIKEIGIRKVLGAPVFHLWRMLSADFVGLVVLSFLISAPIAYYFMHSWLQHYTYHADIAWWVFAAAGLAALVITLLTVSFQTVKAALTNPVKSLRGSE